MTTENSDSPSVRRLLCRAASFCSLCFAVSILSAILFLTILFSALDIPVGIRPFTLGQSLAFIFEKGAAPVLVVFGEILKSLSPWGLIVFVIISVVIWGPSWIRETLFSAKWELPGGIAMKSLPGLAASRSSEIRERASYGYVAAEYYDECYHPTCADFREASRVFLKRMFEIERPSGRLADVGCGRSLILEFASENLVLIDEARAMLDLNLDHLEKRRINIVETPFGDSEFDWIFAVLADPYNEIGAWINVRRALKPQGQCVFIVPSYCWASKFRVSSKNEIAGKARFDLFSGESLFLPSTILLPAQQKDLISSSGLHVDSLDHVYVGDLAAIRSAKISSVLSEDEAVLDIYRVRKR